MEQLRYETSFSSRWKTGHWFITQSQNMHVLALCNKPMTSFPSTTETCFVSKSLPLQKYFLLTLSGKSVFPHGFSIVNT